MKRILMLCVMVGAVVCGVQGYNDPPCAGASISQYPTSQTNCQGATVTFTVGASGTYPLSYQWQKNGNNLSNGSNSWGSTISISSGYTTSQLTISNVKTNDAASYSVIVNNACGTQPSPPATLTVTNQFSPPVITQQPTNQTVIQSSNATFNVTISTNSALPLSYQWNFNGTNISWATNATLTLTNVQLNQAGNYAVLVTNVYGSVPSSNAWLTVNPMCSSPVIIIQPTNTTVTYGQQAAFVVQATGAPPLQYQWKQNGTNIPGATANWYLVPRPQVADSGSYYSVIVSNACGPTPSTNATLMVVKAPLTIRADNKARIYGQTNPSLTWTALGLMYGEGTNVLAGAPGLSTTASNTSPAGNYTITITNGTLSASNYTFTFANGLLSVVKAPLVVTADNQTNTYGMINPSLTWHITGFVNGEGTNVLSGKPQLITPATNTSGVGTYPIVITTGTLSATNYSFGFVNGTLTVTPAALAVTANSTNRVYGAANPVFTATYTGFVNGDTTSVLSGVPALTSAAVSNSPVGSTNIVAAVGTLYAANYNFIAFTNGTLTITPATLTVLADNKTMYVGQTIPPLTWTFSGLVAGDTTNVVSGAPVLSTVSSNSPAGTYTITNAMGTPPLFATNYSFILSNGVLTVLAPSSQITFSNSSMNYLIGGPPTVMDSGMTVIAQGSASFGNAKLTASFVSSQPGDHLSVLDAGTGVGQISVTNASGGSDPYVIAYGISSGTTNIATFTPGSPTNDLVVSFGTNITSAHVQAVARSLTYYCTSTSPSANWRHVRCHITLTNTAASGDVTNAIYPQCPTNIETVLILDKTTSMGTADVGTTNVFGSNRLAAAKSAAISFLNYPQFPADKVRVISFCGDTTDTADNPTFVTTGFYTNQTSLSNAIAGINSMCGTTVYPPSLHAAYTNLIGFTNTQTLPLIIFLTDGEQNGSGQGLVTNWQWAVSEARNDRLAGIRLITIGLGGEVSSNDTTAVNARTLLTQMASSPEDFHISTNGTGLTGVYSNAAYSACRVANLPPTVNAGPDATYAFGVPPYTVTLAGTVTDDGLPTGNSLITTWSLVSPGSVIFGTTTTTNPLTGTAITNIVSTTATFPSPGTYTLQLMASDGALSATDSVSITIQLLPSVPTVFIVNPQNGDTFNAPAAIKLMSVAQDSQGVVTNVSYYNGTNGPFLGSSTVSPYQLTLTNLLKGNYQFVAVAWNDRGLTATSPAVNVTVFPQPPLVSITTPQSNAVFSLGEPIVIQANASDADGWITNLVILTNGVQLSAAATNNISVNWTNAPAGSIQISAIAVDNNGLTATSTVPITVQGCIVPGVSNLVLSVNTILGGGQLTGTVILSNAATTGGQAVNLYSSSTNVIVPASVYVPEGQISNLFVITIIPVIATNVVTVTATYHTQNPSPFASITVIPEGSVSFANGNTNQASGIMTEDLRVLSPEALVREIVGPNFSVSNVHFTGTSNAAGIFIGGSGIIGFDSGIILSSGDITNVIGPNTLSYASCDNYMDGDPDLDQIVAPNLTEDAAVLEFDFVPPADTITWDYVFASEEYNEWVGTFNDVFGFFLNGTNVALLPDGTAVSINNINNGNNNLGYPGYGYPATNPQYYRDNAQGGAGGDAINSPFNTQMDGMTTVLSVSSHVNPGVTNHIKLAIADTNDRYLDSVVMIRSRSFTIGGTTIFTRDDRNQQYNPVTITGPQLGVMASNPAVFDTAGAWGKVTGARVQRAGTLQTTSGSRFDFEIGISALTNPASSFGLLFTNAQKLAGTNHYSVEWELPNSFYADAGAYLGGTYYLNLSNRVSSVCGQAYSATDMPEVAWPWDKNILTLKVLMDRQIPQGRCRDFVLVNGDSPLNGSWDILFQGGVIASSGQPNGWDVEEDHTAYGGFTVTAPTNAVPGNAYEVRVQEPGWSSGSSATFAVMPARSIGSAPVLLPLVLSTNMVSPASMVSFTVSLDAPAPFGDAYVPLYTNGTACSVVVIPAGQTTATTTIQANGSAGSTFEILASYNGYRKARVRVVTGCTTPGQPQILSVSSTAHPSIVLVWGLVANAASYNISRSVNGGGFDLIFSGLTATNFEDTDVIPGIDNSYSYIVTAFSNWCENISAPSSPEGVPYPQTAPAPWIIPNGGTFNDSQNVLLTNYVSGSTIHYTTNGTFSASFANGGTITLTNSTTIKAFVTNPNYSLQSSTVSANFVIVHPTPIHCGDTLPGALTSTNANSTVMGPGWYCQRYIFDATGKVGEQVTVTATSTNFYSLLILKDASTNILEWNDNYYPGDSPDNQIVFPIVNGGVYIIELTSDSPEETGNFTLHLDCANVTSAIMNVFTNAYTNGYTLFTTNSARLPIGGLIDFGTINASTYVTNYVTITNSGNGNLVISNIVIAPAASTNGGNGFSISPTGTITLLPGGITNLAVSLYATNWSSYDGYFLFECNDASRDFFYAYVSGQVSQPSGSPWVYIYYPTNGMMIPVTNSVITNVTLEIDAVAMDMNGITNVTFSINGTPFQTLTSTPNGIYTVFWTNPPAGQQTITAKAYDSLGNSSVTNVTIMVGTPTLTLSPTNACVGLSNTTFTVTATLLNATNGPVSNSNVVFTVTGAHTLSYTNITVNGQVSFTYTGTNAGLDTITASAVVGGIPVQSQPVLKNWAMWVSCGNTYYGSLANTDGTSIACGCAIPSHYTDFYSIAGTANEIITFKMTSTNFSTFMFLMNTNCSPLTVTNEMLNLTDVQMRVSLPSNGTYIVEATSADSFKTGNYSLSVTCGVPPTASDIIVSVNGTNVPNYGLLDLGTTTNGMPLTQTIGVTNIGTATLNLTGYSWYYGLSNVFSITPPPVTSLSPNSGAVFTLQFFSTNSGRFVDALILTNDDPSRNPFVINLNAISIYAGPPPTVSITAPTNNASYVSPATINIQATATNTSGAAITNVVFLFRTSQGTYLIGNDTTQPYSINWGISTPGNYNLLAVAYDNQGGIAISSPVTNVQVRPSTQNQPPKANTDTVTVLANSHNNVLNLLTNDTDPNGYPLTIINYKLSTLPGPHGTVAIVNNGKNISYTPMPGYGSTNLSLIEDGFSYEISNGRPGGTNWGGVYVVIYATEMPQITIVNPPAETTLYAGTTNNITVSITPPDVLPNIVKVQYWVSGDEVGEVTNAPFTVFPWYVRTDPCGCGLRAVAIDKFGQQGVSSAVHYNILLTNNSPQPYAQIDSPSVLSQSPQVAQNGNIERNAVVTDGMLVVTGSVYQEATGSSTPQAAQYKVVIATSDGTVLRDSGWQPAALIQHGPIYTNDLTTLQNDEYNVELFVRNAYQTADAEVPFILDSALKLGVFTFSEQDLVIPAGGMPLSVIRTYNSMNPNLGDFGYSWTYALEDLNVTFNEDRGFVRPDENDIDETGSAYNGANFSIRIGGSRDVTLTLPNGQRTTFYYYEQSCDSLGATACSYYYAPPAAHAQLRPVDANGNDLPGVLQLINGYYVWPSSGGDTPYDNYDFPAFMLTLDDGTQYFIVRGYQGAFDLLPGDDGTDDDWTADSGYYYKAYTDQASVAWIKLPSGEKIVINAPTAGPTGNQFSINYLNVTNQIIRSIYFQRNANGQISAIMDPTSGANGLPVVKYQYDNNTNLVQVLKLVDRNAPTYATNTYLYENGSFPHFLTKILDARGVAVARNLYDDSGKLMGVIDANGKTNLFVYDITGQTETVFDRMGNRTIYGYDTRGNVTTEIDALGHVIQNTYDGQNNLTSTTDALTNTTYYAYDSNGNQTCVIDPLGNTNLMAYDGNNHLIATTNALGKVTRFQYDSRGNQTNTVDALGNHYGVVYDANNKPTTITDPLGRTNATAIYDPSGNLASLTDKSSGATNTFAYDANGNQTDSTNLWVNPTNAADVRVVASHSVYDAQGREISSTDPFGQQTSIAYDAVGKQNQIADGYGKTTSWLYDARGKLIQVSHSDGTITHVVYDDIGRISVSDESHLPGIVANGTRTTYDNVGQVIMSEQLTNVAIGITTDANGISSSAVNSIGGVISTSTYGYDLAGRQIAVTNGFGTVTRYEYDKAGNQTAVIDALNHRTDNIYDEAGRLSVTVNALLQITRYEYDALGRLTRTIYPDGSFTAVAYDAVGNRVAETNQLGLVTTYQYDSTSRMTNIMKAAVFDPESGGPVSPQWGFAYDANGQLKSVSDPKQRMTQFTYDQLGRMVTHTLPLGQTASQIFDNFQRLYRRIDFKGQTKEFIYDSLGRLSTNQFYAAGSGVATNVVTYFYDEFNMAKQVVEPRGTNMFQYDTQEQITQISSPEGVVNYEYEPIEGRRVRTYTANSDLRYTYDELGRVKTVTVMKRDGLAVNPPEVTTNAYTTLGSLQDVFYPNGVHAAYQYDVMNRLTNLTYTASGGTLLAQYAYAPNTNGQWKAATEIQFKVGGGYCTNQLGWFYDNLGRLTNETCGSSLAALNYTNRYVYNLVGNRLWMTNIVGGVTTVVGYTYNTNDQLITDGSFTNWYDANGSLTNRSSLSEQNSYFYNLQNKLATAIISRTDSGQSLSETVNYTYDYRGNRVRAQWVRNIGGNGTNIFLNETMSPAGINQVLEELPAGGATPTVSYTLGTHIVSQGQGGVISHILSDGHGSTRLLTDLSGGVAAQYNYDAYGKAMNFATGILNPPTTKLLYSGEQLDADLQLYNLRARYYNPAVGRFNQVDPFSDNQQKGANLYAYCAGDPVNNSDPNGLYEIDVHQFLTMFLAKAVGFDPNEAKLIGKEAQGPDSPGDPRDAMYNHCPNPNNYKLYHFVSFNRLLTMEEKVLKDYEADKLQGNGPYQNFGEYIHADQDTFAHSTLAGGRDFNYYGDWSGFATGLNGGGACGHAVYGHDPDHTWTDVNKGMCMAEQLYLDMQFAPPGRNKTQWSKISKQIRDFMEFTPDVYWQDQFGYFKVENVTFQGYTDKIHKLDPSYTIDNIYKTGVAPDYDPPYADVAGHKPTNKGLQLNSRGVTTGIQIGINVVDIIGIGF